MLAAWIISKQNLQFLEVTLRDAKEIDFWSQNSKPYICLGIQSPSENGFMEAKYLAFRRWLYTSIILLQGDWIPSFYNLVPFRAASPKQKTTWKNWWPRRFARYELVKKAVYTDIKIRFPYSIERQRWYQIKIHISPPIRDMFLKNVSLSQATLEHPTSDNHNTNSFTMMFLCIWGVSKIPWLTFSYDSTP